MTLAIQLPYISPEILSLDLEYFEINLRWYSLSYIFGFLFAWFWFVKLMQRPGLWPDHQPPIPPKEVEKLLTWNVIGIIVGGRLGYVLFYNPAYYLDWPQEIFMIWQGGMSFHGAFAGLIMATIWYCRSNDYSLASISDTISIVVTPGLALGRLANFINMELYGRPTESILGVIFSAGPGSYCPPEWTAVCARHPTQLYEAALEGLLLCGILCWLAFGRSWLVRPWSITSVFFFGYGLARFLVEFLRQPDMQFTSRDDPVGYAVQFGSLTGLTMGQLLSLPMILFGLYLFHHSRQTSE